MQYFLQNLTKRKKHCVNVNLPASVGLTFQPNRNYISAPPSYQTWFNLCLYVLFHCLDFWTFVWTFVSIQVCVSYQPTVHPGLLALSDVG